MEKCEFCNGDIKIFVTSIKFNKVFCSNDCYKQFRIKLDPNWNDKPIFEGKKHANENARN